MDLKEALSITGLEFFGEGQGKLNVMSNNNDTLFKISLKTKKSSFLDYRFGQIDTDIDLFLGKKFLHIKEAQIKKATFRLFY